MLYIYGLYLYFMKEKISLPLVLFLLALCVVFVRCSKKDNEESNVLTAEEQKEGWTLLFDGKTLANWHIYNKGNAPSEWSVVNGEISCNPDSPDRIGDLISDKDYENYEFQFDWKLPAKGNSGVFVNVVETDSFPAGWFSGPEYQLLEDTHKDFEIPSKRSGCIFGFTAPLNEVKTEADRWYHSKIIQQDGKVKFYLNDVLTTEMDFTSDKWREMVSQSGFSKYPLFGKSTKGKLVLQNWASGVSFRNIKIKEL